MNRSLRKLGMTGIAALLLTGACDNPVRDGGHRTMRDVVITTPDGDTLARTQNNQSWVGSPLVLGAGESLPVRIYFVAPDGTPFQLPTAGASHTLHVGTEQPGIAHYEPVSATAGEFVGGEAGSTTATIHLWHGEHPAGHPDASTPALPIQVQ